DTSPARNTYMMRLYSDADDVRFRQKGIQNFNSSEHVFGTYDALRPTLPLDVVWTVSTDEDKNVELAFDEYLMPNALVLAPMNAPLALAHPRGPTARPQQASFVDDGFVAAHPAEAVRYGATADFRFARSPKLQNASTANRARDGASVRPPSHLTVRGGARVEPVGLGGVRGKGLYLDGENDFVEVPIEAQPDIEDFSISLFVDPRVDEPGPRPRTLVFFPDDSFFALRGGPNGPEVYAYSTADGTARSLPLGALYRAGHFLHLGFAVK